MPDGPFRFVAVDAANAHLVGAIIRSVYGEDFPVRDVYQPDILLKEIDAGRLLSRLALDADGQGAGYISMFKTAPNPRLWEVGGVVSAPQYAHTDISAQLSRYCNDLIESQAADSDGVFMETVCSHYFTQFRAAKIGMVACGLDLDQLDGASFKDGKSNKANVARISCVFSFMEMTDPTEFVYIPVRYDRILRQIAASLRPRNLIPSTARLPTGETTCLEGKYYPSPRTWKLAAPSIGSDWGSVVEDIVSQGKQRKTISLQITLNMALPHVGTAADVLREQGFFFGGMAPRWFGSDGMVMQRLFESDTNYEEIKLYTSIAGNLLAFIRADREAVCSEGMRTDKKLKDEGR